MTKLPHYVLPLYPAIAIMIAGILESYGLTKQRWMVRGTIGWFLLPGAVAIATLVLFIMFGRELGLIAWPFAALAVIFGLFAWWLYEVDGAERSLLRGMLASVFLAITVFAVTFPLLPTLFPSALIARKSRRAIARVRTSHRHLPTRSRVSCFSSALRLGSLMEPALPISCRRDRASSR